MEYELNLTANEEKKLKISLKTYRRIIEE
jgi:hypothetical protein